MTAWSVIAAIGIGTYAMRAAMFVVVGSRRLPTWTSEPLALVAPAAISALVAGMVLTAHGRFHTPALAEVVALAAAFVAVRRRGNVAAALVVGFPVLWLLTAIGA